MSDNARVIIGMIVCLIILLSATYVESVVVPEMNAKRKEQQIAEAEAERIRQEQLAEAERIAEENRKKEEKRKLKEAICEVLEEKQLEGELLEDTDKIKVIIDGKEVTINLNIDNIENLENLTVEDILSEMKKGE